MLSKLYSYLHHRANAPWFNYPWGKQPWGTQEQYLSLWKEAKKVVYPEVDDYEKKLGFSIDSEWINELALHSQIVIKESPLCYVHGRILYTALSHYLSNNKSLQKVFIWETGTARGFSSLCMAKALSDNKRDGTIVTFDVIPHFSEMYWNCIDDLDGPRTRSQLLQAYRPLVENYIIFHQGDTKYELPRVSAERVHFAFLDGSHTYEDVMFEFFQIKQRQQAGDVIVFDDYTPQQFPGLVRAVDEICQDHGYDRVDLQAHQSRGYVIATKK